MKIKKFVAVLTAALLAIGAIFALTACGEPVDPDYQPTKDWSQVKFSEYDPVEYLAKTDVSFSCGKYDGTQTEGASAMICSNLMLYRDGSAFELVSFDKKGVFPIGSNIAAYDDNYIFYVSYGYWTKDGNTITINLKGAHTASIDRVDEEWRTYTGTLNGKVLTVEDFVAEGKNPYAIQSNDYKTMQEFIDDVPMAF